MVMKVVREEDFRKLSALSSAMRRSQRPERAAHLERSLRESLVMDGESARGEFVSLGSDARIKDLASGDVYAYRLVFPGDADVTRGCLSVLSPLGAALLGRRKGETFSYASPGGEMAVKVLGVSAAAENGR